MNNSILYSFRRCPYAMRARMALHVSKTPLEIREIVFRDKPTHMLEVSPKGTVPVLILPDGRVLEESLDILNWALKQNDPEAWNDVDMAQAQTLIQQNDGDFKAALDRYKYVNRFDDVDDPLIYRAQGEAFLQVLNTRLEQHKYLMSDKITRADIAIFPFIRQFANVDYDWFSNLPYQPLQAWLNDRTNSVLFQEIMQKHALWPAA